MSYLFPAFRRQDARSVIVAFCLLLLPVFAFAQAATHKSVDQTESPYFAVNSDDPTVDRLPLKNTDVNVRILGVIADVTVTQEYSNEGTQPLNAKYVFPGSTRAAVYGMTVRLADRVLVAKIKEKQQAKVEYEQAKSEGKTAALLEQERENVFQMNVANIMPGDNVKVELRYTELIVPTDATYQFVFPTVVGPRYNGSVASGSGKAEQWISTPHLLSGELSTAKFAMHINVVAPTAVRDITSPTHAVTLTAVSKQETAVQLTNQSIEGGRNENNRDFILNYSLAGEHIESGLLLSRGISENFFLAMVEPPKQVGAAAIVPREYIFVVDVSGSMFGFPIDTTKVLMNKLLGSLRASDTFNVMMFSGGNTVIAPQSIPATRANIAMATHKLGQQQGGGGTELLPALRKALAIPVDSDRARTFIVITDGYVTVEREAFSLISNNLANANLFAFGIGSSVNRQLIEGMARAGQGEPFIALNADSALVEAERFRKMIDAPVFTHIHARFEGLDAYDIQPASVPDVFAQRPIIIFGKWRGQPKGKLVLDGYAADGKKHIEIAVNGEPSIAKNDALRYLWARHRIASLTDQETLEGGDGYRQSILDLGLQYNLLTQYTSFIAVDHVVRNATGDAANVNQPLPLPQGVSNLAVGAEVPSTPEPSTYAMLALAALGMFCMRKRISNSSRLN